MRSIAALLFCLSLFDVQVAESAEIIRQPDQIMGCQFRIEGKINSGDSKRIEAFVQAFDNDTFYTGPDSELINENGIFDFRRVCLNSPGGSLSEAIRIARVLYGEWGTAVSSNHTCESACALIFMAGSGSTDDDRGIIANRVLHPLGKLGFHAPKLTIDEGNYSAGTVSKAYNVALRGIWEIYDISGFIKFPPSLIGEMIATPPDEMMLVNTVGQASRWQITVAPVVNIRELTNLAVVNACNNHYLYLSEIISLNGFYTRSHKFRYDVSELEIAKSDYGMKVILGGFGQEAASKCNLDYHNITKAHQRIPTKSLGWVSIGEGVGIELHASYLFGPSTPISSLARQKDKVMQKVDTHQYSKDIRTSKGRCFVFSAGSIVDHDPCAQVEEIQFRDNPRIISNFVWPTGAKTIIESMLPDSNETKINGVRTEVEYIESWNREHKFRDIFKANAEKQKITDWETRCWPNPSTSNRFCYQQYFTQPHKFR